MKPLSRLFKRLSMPSPRPETPLGESSEDKLKSILETSLDAVVIMDQDGHITYWGSRAEEIFGRPAKDALGAKMSELIIPDRFREAHHQGLKRFLKTGEPRILGRRIELSALRRDGTEFPIELKVSAYKESGKYTFTSFITDISERKRAEEELARTNRELEQFAAIASHDLQSPIRSVASFLEMLRRSMGNLDQKQNEYFDRIAATISRMNRLIENLLTYSKAGGEAPVSENVDLNSVVRDVLNDLQAEIREKNAKFEIGKLPFVPASRSLIQELFQNLILNALKYSSAAGHLPLVKISSRRAGAMEEISVEDNGPGFDPAYADKIFEPFTRLASGEKGTGLGLAICRKIVDIHGGKISAETKPGSGSSFIIRLPAEPAKKQIART